MARSSGLANRLFTDKERFYCHSKSDSATRYAGTLAAKEAVMKALGVKSLPAWARRIEIVRDESGAPSARVAGVETGTMFISISHDGGVAVAVALRT
jgi:fatty acid synthase subunit alpha